MIKTKYVIIGNSAGGIGAAEAIRGIDKSGSLVVISDEPYPAYSRPMIPEYLAEGCPLEKMLYRPADFYERHNIQTLLGTKVVHLNAEAHTIALAGGEVVTWEKLLLATGGLPIIPQIEGITRSGVFTFTTLDDAKAINHYLKSVSQAVVIGGGLIGVSATEALVKRGVSVTVVEMKERILNVILDEETSALAETALRQAGVDIITGRTVAKINGGSSTRSVSLDDGRRIPCSLVVVAIGVRPRLELALEAGLRTNRGIVVSRKLATSHPDIYACGDAAEAYDFIYRQDRLIPIWPSAYIGGRVAGLNMAGVATEYPGWTAMNSLRYFGLDIVSAGMVTPPDNGYEVMRRQNGQTLRKIILKNGTIVGMVFAGDIEKSGVVFSLMRERINAEGFKEALVAPDFSLVALPEEIWQPRLAPPYPVVASVLAPADQPAEVLVGE